MDYLKLHKKSIVIDGLNASEHGDARVISHLSAGGVTAVNATVAAWHDADFTFGNIEKVEKNIRNNTNIAGRIFNTDDILRCRKENKVGYIFGFQDTAPIEKDLGLLREYYDLGVRIIQLTYNAKNHVGCGCKVPEDTGLTEFGKKMIREMNKLGILIDLSHCGYRTTREAIEYSELPVSFTHANPFSVCRDMRNKPEELFELLAEKGGVAGTVAVPLLLTCDAGTTLGQYIEAIDIMVRLIGEEHVALGPDFMEYMKSETFEAIYKSLDADEQEKYKMSKKIPRLESASKFANITKGMVEWGYSETAIQKILGLNWLHLYEKTW